MPACFGNLPVRFLISFGDPRIRKFGAGGFHATGTCRMSSKSPASEDVESASGVHAEAFLMRHMASTALSSLTVISPCGGGSKLL